MKQLGFLILLILLTVPVFAQSTNENFPTPLAENEISGKIPTRDIGDSRLTRHFYTFFADNGDVNLSLETENFDGDIDLFEAVTLRPLVKITIAAEANSSKTNRVVYFRKREQVVLRIEGRSLTNDPAVYHIAFSGSFAAASGLPASPADDEPKVAEKSNPNAVARVNSAGTIIEVLEPPKPIAKPAPVKTSGNSTVAARRSRTPDKPVVMIKPVNQPPEPAPENSSETAAENPPVKANENVAAKKPAVRTAKPKAAAPTTSVRARNSARTTVKKPVAKKPAEASPSQPDPLANVQLVILLKNGQRVERVMSEVFNVSVDKGQITVITRGGKIEHYNLLDVQKMTIE